ncbi:carbohydrate ABC transporter permease [Deinococcus peraridilitoris]|uniref:Permease component of ABC-type sugar transporter n=1 Tax=Deinococcus peraridilitoris (strain DSM 19664 / LMG 22246 / CIP 109416 / KR-200) TaxID=937777 RepID=K9ZYW8_DEIPD|nr:sugar ABC transporter permease [Deinococcus peraridilitoris]AFZ65955.1 permease component of ABC-type sugar transporter [Deinococcus peraridilitoris DSM 19664]
MRHRLTPWLFLSPFLLAFTVFYLAPVFYALYLSLFIKKRVGFGPAQDVFGGLTNYARALSDTAFLQSLSNIALFGLVQVPLMVGLAVALAIVLDAVKGRAQRVFRTVFYLPYTIPTVIAGLLWGYLYSKNLSPLNQTLAHFGQPGVDLLSSSVILWSVANIVTWTWTGYNMITLYAALQNVSGDIYEAAKIDGADGWNLTRFIKLPLLRPTILLTVIFSIIGTMQIFSEPFVLRPLGYVPDNITPNTYIYLAAARDTQYAYAAAMAILIALVTFVLSGILLRYARLGERA